MDDPARLREPIYLDYNATTPVDSRVVDAMLPYLTRYPGNPSSGHCCGTSPREAVTAARSQVGSIVGASGADVIFCGSGSEANNLAIRGTVLASTAARRHVVTQLTEHPSVLAACRSLERLHGVEVTYLQVDGDGRVDPQVLSEVITPRTVLVSIMHANNETGVVQPVADLARIAHDRGALFHTDAAQTVGKVPVSVPDLDVDLLTIVGHKMYAPKGIAALYRRPGVSLEPIVYGGGQEHGLRAGTENVAGVVALGTSAELAARELASGRAEELRELRDLLFRHLEERLPGRVQVNGDREHRLPHVLNMSLDGIDADELLSATSSSLAASTGSACHAGGTEPSPVLTAMGVDDRRARGTLRLSIGRWTSVDDVERAAHLIATAAASYGAP
ncbi:cysteine desulfurase [Phytoactinopolyspora halotolerans]|uniref:Cysteine desulfurase n=2 Tax=Phytoactinopolyspora halotolerans TaxID=1981512 RepID=A0A6L9SEI3_9ACTN|nr:cysteine desulfurase [Phytoactinopolyspora halotolerans]